MSAQELIIEHLDLWTGAVTKKSSSGRGSNGKVELTGVKKLRELIFELASRGALIPKVNDSARILKLQEFAELVMGQAPPGSECNKNGIGEIFVKTGEFGAVYPEVKEWTTKPLRMARQGDVLICVVGATVGKLNMAIDCAIGRSVAAIRPDETVLAEYLYYCLMPFTLKIRSQSKGSAQGVIGKAVLNNVELRVPPLDEQKLIVQKVDELMALCDRLEQQTSDQLEAHETLVDTLLGTLTQSENATELADNWARLAAHFDTLFTTEQSIDKLKQTILQLAVMGRLVEQDAGDEPATELLKRIQDGKDQLSQSSKQRKAKPLPPISESEEPFSLPSGWTLSRLDDITDIQGGIAKGKKISGKKTHTLPYLRVANVQRSSLDLSEIKEIEIAEDEVERYLVRKRDLLITEGGDWDKVGRTAIWNGPIEPMAHQNHVFRARLLLKEQNERWLERYLNSQFARDYFASSSKQTTNLASINKTQLRSCTIPLPPIEEQHRIVQKVDELMVLCDKLKERLREAGETRRYLAEMVVQRSLH